MKSLALLLCIAAGMVSVFSHWRRPEPVDLTAIEMASRTYEIDGDGAYPPDAWQESTYDRFFRLCKTAFEK